MDKEKEIEGMLKHNTDYCDAIGCESCFKCVYHDFAEKLVNAGYGNVKQAVKEFAEKFCDLLWIKCGIYKAHSERLGQEVMKVLYGADE